MKKVLLAAAVVWFAAPLSAKALMIAPAPIPQRVAQSEVVISGKVTTIEDKTVMAERFPGDKEKGEFRIAIVKIDNGILGAQGLTHAKVGYHVPPPPPPLDPTQPRLSTRRYPMFKLEKDQEVLLFLKPHSKESFLVGQAYTDVVDKKDPEFVKNVAEAKKAAKVLADPMAGLQVTGAQARFDAAAILISKYRMQTQPNMKPEPIDAKESKLILEAIRDANWAAQPTRPFEMTPLSAFQQLGLTPQDGWTQPRDFKQFQQAAQAWLKANAESYRIKRFVVQK